MANEIVYVGGEKGLQAVPKSELRPSTTISEKAQRIQDMYKGVRMAKEYLQRLGFELVTDATLTASGQLGPLLVDFKIASEVPNVAYVTSSPAFDPKKAGTRESGAGIYHLRDAISGHFFLQVNINTNDGLGGMPVFVPLDDTPNIIREIALGVRNTLVQFIRSHHGLAERVRKFKAHSPHGEQAEDIMRLLNLEPDALRLPPKV